MVRFILQFTVTNRSIVLFVATGQILNWTNSLLDIFSGGQILRWTDSQVEKFSGGQILR